MLSWLLTVSVHLPVMHHHSNISIIVIKHQKDDQWWLFKLYWNRYKEQSASEFRSKWKWTGNIVYTSLCCFSSSYTDISASLHTVETMLYLWSQLFHINKYICGNNPVCRKTCQKLNKSDRKETSPPAALPSVTDILSSVRFQLLISVPTPPGTQHVSGNIPTLTESFQPESVTEKQNALIKGLYILWPLCETWLLLSALGQHGNTLITAAEQNAFCCTPADSHGPLPPFCICAAGFSIKRVFWLQKQCSSDQHLCCVVLRCACVCECDVFVEVDETPQHSVEYGVHLVQCLN